MVRVACFGRLNAWRLVVSVVPCCRPLAFKLDDVLVPGLGRGGSGRRRFWWVASRVQPSWWMRWYAVRSSSAVGQASMMRMIIEPARLTMRAGVCQSVQRSRFGCAVAR